MTPPGRTVPQNRWDQLAGVWPPAPPTVSVVVVHCDQPVQLKRTLEALDRQDHPADRLEVIVVDDGSREPPRVPDGVTLLGQEDRGFRAAAARNLGARHARGDVLCFLDADTTPEPDYVRALTRLPALAPEAVTVGRRRHADFHGVAVDAPVERAGPEHELSAPAWLAQGYADTADLLRADDRSYRYVISAVLATSSWFFALVGGFDETLEGYGGEDWDWAHRAWLAGALPAHVPDAVAWHDGPDWAGREEDRRTRRVAKNRETLQLADRIAVAGSRPHALRTREVDVVVRLPPADVSPAAAFVCVDALLTALPEAAVVVPAALAPVFAADPRVAAQTDARPRVVVELVQLVSARDSAALRAAVDRVGVEQLGTLTATGADGAVLLHVRSVRAAARTARWADPGLFPDIIEPVPGLEALEDHPDVEAHLGGWA